jgi:thiol-disulfide isomerase/thioredoxin
MRWVNLILFSFLLLTIGCQESPPLTEGIKPGTQAIDIVGKNIDGKVIKLSDLKGKVVLIDFWASWCGPCVYAIPHTQELVNLHKGKPFAVLGISQDRSSEDLKRFLEKNPLSWNNIFDEDSVIFQEWKGQGIPLFVLVDDQGIIRGRWEGAGDLKQIQVTVAELVRKAEARSH